MNIWHMCKYVKFLGEKKNTRHFLKRERETEKNRVGQDMKYIHDHFDVILLQT